MKDDEVIPLVESVKSQLTRLRPLIASVHSGPELPEPRNVLTNSELLLRALKAFFKREGKKTPFLPYTVKSPITLKLRKSEGFLSPLVVPSADDPSPPDQSEAISNALKQLDGLYAHCLMYGIISFGLGSNVAKEHANQLHSYVIEAETAKDETVSALQAALTEVSEQIARDTSSATDGLGELRGRLHSAQQVAANAIAHLADAQRASAEAQKLNEAMSELMASASEQREVLKDTADELIASIEVAKKQTVDLAASAKAEARIVLDTKAQITAEQKEMSSFYAKMETYKKDVVEMQRATESTISKLSERTDAVVKKNEAFAGEIKRHLEGAVTVSLFHAFDARTKSLAKRTWTWAIALFASVVGAVGFAAWFARSLTVPDIRASVIFAKFLVAAPIAFVIGFAARQYMRERRAEEEYAFKATQSLSLEPYRDLVDRMATGKKDTTFVQKLIEDIFDNPTKRLYPPRNFAEPDGDGSSAAK